MGNQGEKSAEELLADKRRQAYWRRRSQVKRAAAKSALLAPERMTTIHLWLQLTTELMDLEDQLEGGSSPRMYGATRRALECANELRLRGEQMSLPL